MKKKRNVVIFLIVLIITAAACLGYVFKSAVLKRLSPEKYMETVFINTVRSLERDILKLPDNTALTGDNYEFSLSLGLKDYKLDLIPADFEYTMEALKLITFNSNSKADRKARMLENEIKVLAGGIDMADFTLFFTDDMYAVRCETLTDKTVTINPNTFVSDWNASPFLVPLTNFTMPDFVKVDGLNEYIFSDKSVFKNIGVDLTALLKNESVDFLMSADVKYVGIKDGFDVVEAKYPKDAVNKLYVLYADALVSEFEDRFSVYLKLASDYEQAYVPLLLIESYKDSILSVSFEEDLEVTFYIDGKDVIRRLEIAGANIDSSSGSEPAQISVDLRGDEYLSDDVVFELKLGTETTVKVTNNLEGSGPRSLNHELSVDISAAGGNSSHRYSAGWTPDDSGEFNLSYAYGSDDNKLDFSLNGQLSGDGDEISLKNGLLSASFNESSIELKAGYTIRRYNGGVQFDDTNAFSFFDINIFELNSIYMKAQNFLYSF